MSKRTLTELYLGAILVTIIVLLMTVKWFEIPRLVDYMTFGSSIASIVLALFAISYSVFSGSSMDRGMASLSTSIEQIKSVTTNIGDLYGRLREDVKGSSTSVETSLRNFQDTLERNGRIPNTRIQLAERGHLDGVEESPKLLLDDSTHVNIIDFASRGSFIGAVLMYVVIGCWKKSEYFSIKDIRTILSANDDYIYGYLIAAEASGVLSSIMPGIDKPVGIIRIATVDENAMEKVEEMITSWLESKPANDSLRLGNETILKNIKNYLETGVVTPLFTVSK